MFDRDSGSRDAWSASDPIRFWGLPGDLGGRDRSESVGPRARPTLPPGPEGGGPPPPAGPDDLDFSLHLVEEGDPAGAAPPLSSGPSAAPAPWMRAGPRYPAPGEVVAGFRVVRELGRGAFARVYLAEQLDLADRQVALKVSAQPVVDESQLLARLQHAHIVPIHSVHEDRGSGMHLICMPYLGGANLAQVLEAAGVDSGEGAPGTGGSLVAALDQVGGPPPSLPASRRASHRPTGPAGPAAPAESGRDEAAGPSAGVRSMLTRYWSRLTDWGLVPDEAGADGSDPDLDQPARRFLRHASYIRASAWIAARLAEGLEHAHRRGLLHRDLKPSNVLITADGMPMILDFNLSAVAEGEGGPRARIGGTLPYMAPEHLDAFHPGGSTPPEAVDERSDLYALGLILFEMVAGRHPFREPPDGPPLAQVLDGMIAERRAGPPSARGANPEVPWGLDSVIRTCLEPDPCRRYQSAAELAEDLRRFLDDRPLRTAPEPSVRERLAKLLRRNPQLTGSTAIAMVSLALILGFGGLLWAVRGQWEAAASRLALRDFADDFTRCQLLLNTDTDADGLVDGGQLARGIARAREALARYEVEALGRRWVEGPMARSLAEADRMILGEQLAELLMLEAKAAVVAARDGPEGQYARALARAIARLDLAEQIEPRPPATLFAERASYAAALGLADRAEADRRRAASTRPETARDFYLLGTASLAAGRADRAERELELAISIAPRRFWSWFALGLCHFDQDRYGEAAADFAACTLLDPGSAWAHANRGLALALDGRVAEARRSYDRAVAIDPDLVPARINRALACLELDDPKQAAADLEFALGRTGRRDPALLASWGEALARAGRRAEADRRFAEALAARPDDPTLLVARGFSRIQADPASARVDLKRAIASPAAAGAVRARARLGLALLVRDADPPSALGHLDEAIRAEPGLIDAVQLRALIRARLGDRSALADVDVLRRSPSPHRLYNASAAVSLLSETADDPALGPDAVSLLRRAIDAGFDPAAARRDPDFDPIRHLPGFAALFNGGD